ncbi:MAG: hypothetical protein RLZZ214_4364 [Verrucomicrobiota bacterium]
MKKINFMLTAFRDGFQSVYGARVFSFDYLPCVEFAAKECGITHFEAGGGAMFQSPFFYSNENAFDVMDAFRRATGPDAVLQTLSRGINTVALKAQPQDILKLHAQLFKKHGMSAIRNCDALNDAHNLVASGHCIVDAGLKHEVSITMMDLPPGCRGSHTVEFYEKTLRDILDSKLAYDSICFKDSSGTANPRKVHDTIKMARRILGDDVKIAFHSHNTAGTCVTAYMAALEAGADQIDLSLAPVSGGASQPDVLTMWHALKGTNYELDINVLKIIELEEMFKEAMKGYFLPPESMRVDPLIPFSPMPGGALTANTQMLRDNDLMSRYSEVVAALGEVIKKGGLGSSVTPVSQFYFQQAFNNVMFGPWKQIARGYGKMVLGYFGRTPIPPDATIVKIAMDQLGLEPTVEHLDYLENDPARGAAAAKAVLKVEHLPVNNENIFIVATCAEKGVTFLKGQATIGVRKRSQGRPSDAGAAPAPLPVPAFSSAPSVCTVALNGNTYRIVLDGTNALVNGTMYDVEVSESGQPAQPAPMVPGMPEESAPTAAPVKAAPVAAPPKPAAPKAATKGVGQPLITQLPGLVLRIEKPVGSAVKVGETVLIIESMKMDNAIVSSVSGTIAEVHVKQGDQVQAGQELALIR